MIVDSNHNFFEIAQISKLTKLEVLREHEQLLWNNIFRLIILIIIITQFDKVPETPL